MEHTNINITMTQNRIKINKWNKYINHRLVGYSNTRYVDKMVFDCVGY